MLESIKLTQLLSFGEPTEISFNKGLNVLIGTNGSGKSNLIEAISLLQALPKDLTKTIRDGGGIEEWLWKGKKDSVAEIEVVIENKNGKIPFQHNFIFSNTEYYRLDILKENISVFDLPDYFYVSNNGFATHKTRESEYQFTVKTNQSVLAQYREPDAYPEMAYLSDKYQKIRLYREWHFGRNTNQRNLQRADLPNDFLEEDGSNLGLMLNSLRRNSETKKKLLESLKCFNESIEDFDVSVQGGYVQVFFHENGFTIPATRLSDGTLRYLSLLAILLNPNPPPLICIEEPELGLHPDVLPTLIELLKEAAQKTQIIITTHSADLIDELSDMPETVLVFDKENGSTSVKRLNKEELNDWLDDYRLGQLWRRGDIGGNRW